MKIMKNYIGLVLLSLSLLAPSLVADSSTRLSLELARANKMQNVIKRMNSVYEYANNYILQTSDSNITKDKIKAKFSLTEQSFKGYSGNSFTISYEDQKIVFEDATPSNLTPKMKKLIKNSSELSPRAVYEDNKFSYIVSPKVRSFLATKGLISSGNKPKVLKSKADLTSLNLSRGSVVYVENNQTVEAYVMGKTGWIKESATSNNSLSTASECTTNTLGAIRVSKEKGCNQYCANNSGTPAWKCFDGGGTTANNNVNISKIYDKTVTRASCKAHKDAGATEDGIYKVNPTGTEYNTYCDITTDIDWSTDGSWTNVALGSWIGWGIPKGYFSGNKAYANGNTNYNSGLHNDVPLNLTKELQISYVITQSLSSGSFHHYLYAGIIFTTADPGGYSSGSPLLNYIYVNGGQANIRIGAENVGINNGKPLHCTINYLPIGNGKIKIHYKIVNDTNQVIEKTDIVTTNKTIGYISFYGKAGSSVSDISILTK